MDTIRNDELRIPSGLEVDTAVFTEVVNLPPALPAPTLKDRVDELRLRGVEAAGSVMHRLDALQQSAAMKTDELKRGVMLKTSELQRNVSMKTDELKRNVSMKSDELKRTATTRVAGVQQDIHTNPRKWAGIAAGAGLGLGLIGRYLSHRSK
ncbi:MAG TPA: hypothetical protein VGR02_14805, partial [Thermoanaerobaculia bacterium]|nr:hypothetical protein [Thermoanaerobaculia bacterium]